jgi:UDP-N-acetylmuramate-alanine ligase
MVAEADESDGSFLKMKPTIAVVTNIDREHLDHYRDREIRTRSSASCPRSLLRRRGRLPG